MEVPSTSNALGSVPGAGSPIVDPNGDGSKTLKRVRGIFHKAFGLVIQQVLRVTRHLSLTVPSNRRPHRISQSWYCFQSASMIRCSWSGGSTPELGTRLQ